MKLFFTALVLVSGFSFVYGQSTYSIRKEFRSDCSGGNRELVSTEEFDKNQKQVSSIHAKRKTEFIYVAEGNVVTKIHRELNGKLLRYNKIYYNDQKEYFVDTLFNADSTATMIFRRRHSKRMNEDIVTWDNLSQKGSTVIQTIKMDEMKNEIENTVCTSSSECTIVRNSYAGKNLVKSEVFRREEMNRKPVLIETQTYEYDSSQRLVKTIFMNEIDKMCSHQLTYTYE